MLHTPIARSKSLFHASPPPLLSTRTGAAELFTLSIRGLHLRAIEGDVCAKNCSGRDARAIQCVLMWGTAERHCGGTWKAVILALPLILNSGPAMPPLEIVCPRRFKRRGRGEDPLPNGGLSGRDRRNDTIPEGRVGATN